MTLWQPEYQDVLFARVNADTDGDNTVLAGVAGKKLRVMGYMFTSTNAAAAIATVKSGATVLAELQFGVNGALAYAGNQQAPAFETAVGQALVINCAVAQDINGHLAYVEV